MKLIIDVDEKLVCEGFERHFTEEEKDILIRAIGHGTSLPREHGRLIILSEDKLKENQINLDFSCTKWISDVGLSNATIIIIEVDKETENEVN